MVLGSRNWYARIGDTIYCFQSKKHRNNCGGQPISAKEAYKDYGNIVDVMFWQYKKWRAGQ